MITCYFGCVAEKAIVNQNTSVLSVIEIVEEIGAPFFPLVLPRVNAVFSFQREQTDPDSASLQLKASTADVTIVEQTFNVAFSGKEKGRVTFEFQGFPVPQSGLLVFVVSDGERTLAKWTILVKQTVQVGTAGGQEIKPSH